jgi:hypothetical protein
MKKIKVALCYSGAVRGLLNNLSQIKNVLFYEDYYEIDYYLYADPNGATIHQKDIDKGKIEPQGLKVKKEKPEFNCLFENELDGFEERFKIFCDRIENYHMPYKEQVHQWYSVKKAFDYALSFDKEYDIYVRLRCDLFPAGKMFFDWEKFDINTVYVPFNAPFGGINDRFAFGSKEAMRRYSNFYGSDIYYSAKNIQNSVIEKAKNFFTENYGHISTESYGGCGHNSEFRLLNYLFEQHLNVKLLPPDILHVGSVRDSDGLIRYPGPDLEEKLIKFNNFKIEELVYDRIWWR